MVARRSICVPHVRQRDHRTAGSPGGICFSAKDDLLPHCPTDIDAQDDGGRGLLRFCGAHEGSTKVLATKGSGKTPTVYASVASAVAFMGPKWW